MEKINISSFNVLEEYKEDNLKTYNNLIEKGILTQLQNDPLNQLEISLKFLLLVSDIIEENNVKAKKLISHLFTLFLVDLTDKGFKDCFYFNLSNANKFSFLFLLSSVRSINSFKIEEKEKYSDLILNILDQLN